ncbi:MAG: hypothetical protein EHM61_18110 [Acidobacteria bacterium]|nr:MAG: hypothetical protein EHM61_18110 [Acidobacteriota bacterium]
MHEQLSQIKDDERGSLPGSAAVSAPLGQGASPPLPGLPYQRRCQRRGRGGDAPRPSAAETAALPALLERNLNLEGGGLAVAAICLSHHRRNNLVQFGDRGAGHLPDRRYLFLGGGRQLVRHSRLPWRRIDLLCHGKSRL